MPRPKSLELSDIAAAALAVVEQDGLSALSMRAVASKLGVGTMSLYRYVDSRDQIEEMVVAALFDRVDTAVPSGTSWSEEVTVLVERVREAVADHPEILPLLLTRRHRSAGTIRWGEAILGALAKGGFNGADRVIAFRTLLSYLFGALQVEHLGPLSGSGTAALAELPQDDYPHLAETAAHASSIPVEEEFRRGLDVVLQGLRQQLIAPV